MQLNMNIIKDMKSYSNGPNNKNKASKNWKCFVTSSFQIKTRMAIPLQSKLLAKFFLNAEKMTVNQLNSKLNN